MISWTASRSKLRQASARTSHVSRLRLRDDPSLRMMKDPRSTEPYSRCGRPNLSGSSSNRVLISFHSPDVNCFAMLLSILL